MSASLLPNQQPPESVPIGQKNPDGSVTINHQWWLFLYNLFTTVFPGGKIPTMTTTTIALTGSGSGKPIPVNTSSSPGVLVHTAPTSAGSYDQLYIWASNVTNAAATLTVQWGGSANVGSDLVQSYSIPANSAPMPIATGQLLNGGLVVYANSGTPNAINLTGYAIRNA